MSTLLTKEVNQEIRKIFKASRDAFLTEYFIRQPVSPTRDIGGTAPTVFVDLQEAILAGARVSNVFKQPPQFPPFINITVDRPQAEIDAERIAKEMDAENQLKALITAKVLEGVKAKRAKEAQEAEQARIKAEQEEQARLDMDESSKIALAIEAMFKEVE